MNFPRSLIESLRNARRIVALTGAGISAESGLATFRDAQTGLWSKFKPEELATADAFRRNPKLVSEGTRGDANKHLKLNRTPLITLWPKCKNACPSLRSSLKMSMACTC